MVLNQLECLLLIAYRLGMTKTGQGARIEGIARGIPTLIVPGKNASKCWLDKNLT